MAQAAYNKVINNYALHTELENFIRQTKNKVKQVKLPELKKSVFNITTREIDLGKEKLSFILKKHDYVAFQKGKAEHLKYKNYFQIYSLIKSHKPISCCNYYVRAPIIGDYMLFFANEAASTMDRLKFNALLDINQLLVEKKHFLNNYEQFKSAFHGKIIDFVNHDTTIFVAIPLISLKKTKTKDYDALQKAFGFKFIYRLYSSLYQKRFLDPYLYAWFFQALTTKPFMMRALIDNLKDKNIWAKFKKLK